MQDIPFTVKLSDLSLASQKLNSFWSGKNDTNNYMLIEASEGS